ncbi:hypothetical protein [Nannocystis sp. SCPEA4]|uniref:hypothetical protein n=1 Tax=Nannocystis sp. SCPEA4 TaxID=2996787 RepID=UPI00226F48B9|nr:hypothetical protein [Nannocystis sp. SCPEA4]MCY1061138.1 hypothetical protein [Nannocystis sp. SCPEA4]
MKQTFTVRYAHAIEPDLFWRSVFFDREYNERLLREVYRYWSWEIVEDTVLPDGRRTRKVRLTAGVNAPAALRKQAGDSVAVVEVGTLELEGPHAPMWITRYLVPRPMVFSLLTRFWLERTGPGQSDWVVEVELESRSAEALEVVRETLLESYPKIAEFTERWLREHRDTLADPSPDVQNRRECQQRSSI